MVETGMPRIANVILASVMGIAVFGFFVGTRPISQPILANRGETVSNEPGDALPGQPYWALRERRFGLNAALTSDLGLLRAALPKVSDPVTIGEGDRAIALATRTQRRAYEGAPPTVPHVVDEQSAQACLACHRDGLAVHGRIAPKMSHIEHGSCTQCHVLSFRAGVPGIGEENSFAGLVAPGPGSRAWQGAPPTVPHAFQMREQCNSCHGLAGLNGLRTSHPGRESCVQCHVPSRAPLPWID